MVTTAYDIGDLRQLKATFTDISGTLTNPTGITLTVREPDGVLTTKNIGELSSGTTGIYTFNFAVTKPGRHIVNWAGTAGVVTAEETEFYIRKKGAL